MGYSELEKFAQSYLTVNAQNTRLEQLPEACCIGIILYFFNENEIDFSLADTTPNVISDAIVEAFGGYEKVIGHYS